MIATLMAGGCGDREDDAACTSTTIDSAAWQRDETPRQGEATARQAMGDRIVACRLLVGRGRAHVRAVLGPPDAGSPDRRWSYTTGSNRDAFGLDAEVLVVFFDRHGRVRRSEIVRG